MMPNTRYASQTATLALLVLWIVLVALVSITVPTKNRDFSPIPNTTMDKDGVIRLNPQNGCGPLAHVENYPDIGPLCVQNEGSWKVSSGASSASKESPPCISVGGAGVESNGPLLSCQSPGSAWTSPR